MPPPLAALAGQRPAAPAWFDAALANQPQREHVIHDGVPIEVLSWGLRGLECYYPRYDAATTARMAAFAQATGLLATGGSDYHGDLMDYATAQEALLVPDAVADRLLEALAA